MTQVTRTATIQARVVPAIKKASERILWRIGLNMSEAMELFLRRIIVDERIPFDVVALDATQAAIPMIAEEGSATTQRITKDVTRLRIKRDQKKRI